RSAVVKFIILRGPRALNEHEGLVFVRHFPKNKVLEFSIVYCLERMLPSHRISNFSRLIPDLAVSGVNALQIAQNEGNRTGFSPSQFWCATLCRADGFAVAACFSFNRSVSYTRA